MNESLEMEKHGWSSDQGVEGSDYRWDSQWSGVPALEPGLPAYFGGQSIHGDPNLHDQSHKESRGEGREVEKNQITRYIGN